LPYDVIVVGAGPAGAVLAYDLARRGVRVLIIEKEALPRYKACGGGLPLKTIRSLPFDVSAVLEREADCGIVSYGGRELLRAVVRRPFAWLVMRDRFDHYLVERAVEAGARLMDGLRVTGVEERNGRVAAATGKGRFFARLLAGADGVDSLVARSVELLPRRSAGTAMEAEVAVPSRAMEAQGAGATFDFGALPHGYGWIFPKTGHLSAGVFSARPGKAAGLKRHLERFLASQPVLRDHRVLTWRGHRIPLGGTEEVLHRGRVLLTGDSANLADPWLGEGVYYAVLSARIAGEVMCSALSSASADLSAYTARVHARIVAQLRYARRLAGFVYRFPHLCSVLLSRSRAMQDAVFGVVRGDCTFQQLGRVLVSRMPLILVQALRGV
jgi:geranylgeranyl reductase family protein